MKRQLGTVPAALILGSVLLPNPALAQCAVPNLLTNGQVADASEVMDNFYAVAACSDDLADAAVTHTGTPQTGALAVFSGPASVTSADLSGDVSTSGGTITTLAPTGVAAGTYSNPLIEVDAKGRITAAASGTGGSGGGAGSIFPGSPGAGERFFRTDRGIEYYWDGTRWLSSQLFTLSLPWHVALDSDRDAFFAIPWAGTYGVYLVRFEASTFRVGAGEWDLQLRSRPQNNLPDTVLATLDGAGLTTAIWNRQSVAINAVVDPSAYTFLVFYDHVAGYTQIYTGPLLHYRLVG